MRALALFLATVLVAASVAAHTDVEAPAGLLHDVLHMVGEFGPVLALLVAGMAVYLFVDRLRHSGV